MAAYNKKKIQRGRKMKTRKKKFSGALLVVFLLLGNMVALPPANMQVQAETTVYITPTGSKYHSHKCGNGTYSPTSLSHAQSLGLEPCKKCFPGGAPADSGAENNGSGNANASASAKPPVKKIALSNTALVLVKGTSQKLKLKNASGAVKWKSSKSAVASVSNGTVKAKAKGKAVISATANGQTKTCRVKVEDAKISKTALHIAAGKTAKLKVSGCIHDIRWSSTDTDVARVDGNGNIKAYKAGRTCIKAEAHGKVWKCVVKVNRPKAA